MFSVLISRRAVSRRPHCVYLEKQNKIVCIIRSATRAALEGSPAGSFRLQRAPAAVDPQPQPSARPTTTSARWDGLWGPRCVPCPAAHGHAVLQLHIPLPKLGLAAHPSPASTGHSPLKCPSPAAQSLAVLHPPSFPPAQPQCKAGMFPAVSVWGIFLLPQSLPHVWEFPPNITEPGMLSVPALAAATRRFQQCRDG